MSCYWNIRCFTCNESVNVHANHAGDGLASLVKIATHEVNTLKRIDKSLINYILIDLEKYGIWGDYVHYIPIMWFVTHEGHDIDAVNEYGQRIGAYNAEVASWGKSTT